VAAALGLLELIAAEALDAAPMAATNAMGIPTRSRFRNE
jgi:hypothetical protein